MSGGPGTYVFIGPATEEQKRIDQQRDLEARRWYHRVVPGGMPRDWVIRCPEDPLVLRAALLSAWKLLHENPGCDCGRAS